MLHMHFCCNHPATTEIYTLSLHDALPISARAVVLAAYDRMEDTVLSLDDLFAAGLLPSTAELLDRSAVEAIDRKSTRLNSSHGYISYAVFCLKKKKQTTGHTPVVRRL